MALKGSSRRVLRMGGRPVPGPSQPAALPPPRLETLGRRAWFRSALWGHQDPRGQLFCSPPGSVMAEVSPPRLSDGGDRPRSSSPPASPGPFFDFDPELGVSRPLPGLKGPPSTAPRRWAPPSLWGPPWAPLNRGVCGLKPAKNSRSWRQRGEKALEKMPAGPMFWDSGFPDFWSGVPKSGLTSPNSDHLNSFGGAGGGPSGCLRLPKSPSPRLAAGLLPVSSAWSRGLGRLTSVKVCASGFRLLPLRGSCLGGGLGMGRERDIKGGRPGKTRWVKKNLLLG